jgi:hypothetical protein
VFWLRALNRALENTLQKPIRGGKIFSESSFAIWHANHLAKLPSKNILSKRANILKHFLFFLNKY